MLPSEEEAIPVQDPFVCVAVFVKVLFVQLCGEAFKDKLGEDFEPKKAPEEEHQDKIDGDKEHKVCCFK